MKELIKYLALSLVVFSTSAIAGSGKAIVPHWAANDSRQAYVYVSNITSNAIKVTVTFYGKNGSVVAHKTPSNFTNGNTELAAGSSSYIGIEPSSFDYGYALIEWENLQGDDNAVALTAHGFRMEINTSSTRSEYAIPINNGQPF